MIAASVLIGAGLLGFAGASSTLLAQGNDGSAVTAPPFGQPLQQRPQRQQQRQQPSGPPQQQTAPAPSQSVPTTPAPMMRQATETSTDQLLDDSLAFDPDRIAQARAKAAENPPQN
ncbi:MAG: hypothetical protein FJX54_12815 [Alphaproteobacteria bacterium]|nr:hypothetical protein [Alphaproteobacteria bacterium]